MVNENRSVDAWISAAVAAPAAAVGIGLLLFIMGVWPAGPNRRISPGDQDALIDAVASGQVGIVGAAARRGVDINLPGAYTDEKLFGDAPIQATPLFAAVARRNEDMTRVLVGAGADLSEPANLSAVCLAFATEQAHLLALFEQAGVDVARAVSCDGFAWPPPPVP